MTLKRGRIVGLSPILAALLFLGPITVAALPRTVIVNCPTDDLKVAMGTASQDWTQRMNTSTGGNELTEGCS